MKQHSTENEFSKNKFKYNDKIIDYKHSPTGKAYIGLAKEPLMKTESGIGFQGVKLQSENRELIQCNECGKWCKILTVKHLKEHGMTLVEYKKKYGFNKRTALCSDEQSRIRSARIIDTIHGIPNTPPQRELMKLREGKQKKTSSIEEQNNLGTCPLQLKTAFINHINRFRKIPTGLSHHDGYVQLPTVIRRFGSLNNALKEWGLPTKHKMGANIEFAFPDGTVFWTKKGKGYEELYLIMKDKCPVLNNVNAN
ncbi:MAG: MucR family transcriptional regulator [bacterium]|nr:MucR family transcriptional regulator [bacterium]